MLFSDELVQLGNHVQRLRVLWVCIQALLHEIQRLYVPSHLLHCHCGAQKCFFVGGLTLQGRCRVIECLAPLLLAQPGLRAVRVQRGLELLGAVALDDAQGPRPLVGGLLVLLRGEERVPLLLQGLRSGARGGRLIIHAPYLRQGERATEGAPALFGRHQGLGLGGVQRFTVLAEDPPVARLPGPPVRVLLPREEAPLVILEDGRLEQDLPRGGVRPVGVVEPGTSDNEGRRGLDHDHGGG
mmetsp:Transcript_50932/g.143355  ORF Transcript_50932/g.143355 Transcript_50932/m.143355 type:complete len:241 (+) Transcript_50932:913-1635(+)